MILITFLHWPTGPWPTGPWPTGPWPTGPWPTGPCAAHTRPHVSGSHDSVWTNKGPRTNMPTTCQQADQGPTSGPRTNKCVDQQLSVAWRAPKTWRAACTHQHTGLVDAHASILHSYRIEWPVISYDTMIVIMYWYPGQLGPMPGGVLSELSKPEGLPSPS